MKKHTIEYTALFNPQGPGEELIKHMNRVLAGNEKQLYKITPIWYTIKIGPHIYQLIGLDTGQWSCYCETAIMQSLTSPSKQALFNELQITSID